MWTIEDIEKRISWETEEIFTNVADRKNFDTLGIENLRSKGRSRYMTTSLVSPN